MTMKFTYVYPDTTGTEQTCSTEQRPCRRRDRPTVPTAAAHPHLDRRQRQDHAAPRGAARARVDALTSTAEVTNTARAPAALREELAGTINPAYGAARRCCSAS